jgi:20S proteasome alpha/beta subunit
MQPLATGTTTLGIVCPNGVLLASNSHVTMGGIIASREHSKVTSIAPNIYTAHCGSLADTQFLERIARTYVNAHAVFADNSTKPKVSIAAQVFRRALQVNKGSISAEMILGGVDADGAHVYTVLPNGMGLERNFVANGDGSVALSGYFDDYFRPGMKLEEAEVWAVNALTFAGIRNLRAGGAIQIVGIGKEEVKVKWYAPDKQPFGVEIVKT